MASFYPNHPEELKMAKCPVLVEGLGVALLFRSFL